MYMDAKAETVWEELRCPIWDMDMSLNARRVWDLGTKTVVIVAVWLAY